MTIFNMAATALDQCASLRGDTFAFAMIFALIVGYLLHVAGNRYLLRVQTKRSKGAKVVSGSARSTAKRSEFIEGDFDSDKKNENGDADDDGKEAALYNLYHRAEL